MNRRSFTYQASMLLPALFLSPKALWAADKSTKKVAAVLMLQTNKENSSNVLQEMKTGALPHELLSPADVKAISYSTKGFEITLNNDEVLHTPKLFANQDFMIDTASNRISLKNGSQQYFIDFRSTNCTKKPSLVFQDAAKLGDGFAAAMMAKASSPVLMCIG